MGFQLEIGVPALTVFAQGILSFFSPCVLPLVPLYVGYLAGGARTTDENGRIVYPRKRVLVNTLFFVVGISCAFLILGLGFSALGRFFNNSRAWFARVSGIIMIVFGLYQLGALGKVMAIERERRLPLQLGKLSMNPITALILGFTFSFAWTPCVGPTLGSVLLMVSSAGQKTQGLLLIGVYTLGFVIPFLAVGLFTGTVLDFFKAHQSVVRYTVKIGAALMIFMGIMTFTGYMNGITSYLSSLGNGSGAVADSAREDADGGDSGEGQAGAAPEQGSDSGEAGAGEGQAGAAPEQGSDSGEAGSSGGQSGAASDQPGAASDQSAAEPEAIPAPDFTWTDQNGQSHTLSEYKGKTVFLNFWATWCGPCRSEMPEIQALYERYGSNQGDLIVLGVANPKTEEQPYNNDGTVEEVAQFMEENGYTFPTVMDTTGETLMAYGISAFPTTFMIDTEGNVFGYVPGALSGDMMESIVQQTMTGEREQ